MAASITKKVRLSEEHAELLRTLAEKRGTSESDVLREGLLLLRDQEKRERAVEGLIDMMRYGSPEKEPFELQ